MHVSKKAPSVNVQSNVMKIADFAPNTFRIKIDTDD